MLYNRGETVIFRPRLRTLVDKFLQRYPNQDPFWDRVIKKYPQWTCEQPGWTEFAEPLSDDVEKLGEIISSSVGDDDVVLTTIIHAPFFARQTKNIHVYDISPYQLRGNLGKCPDVESTWFCDVFHPPMVSEMLAETQPTVIYLSNIIDYGNKKQSKRLLSQLNEFRSIREILCSTLCRWGETPDQVSSYMAKLSKEVGWYCQPYPVDDTQALFRITRQRGNWSG